MRVLEVYFEFRGGMPNLTRNIHGALEEAVLKALTDCEVSIDPPPAFLSQVYTAGDTEECKVLVSLSSVSPDAFLKIENAVQTEVFQYLDDGQKCVVVCHGRDV